MTQMWLFCALTTYAQGPVRLMINPGLPAAPLTGLLLHQLQVAGVQLSEGVDLLHT